jgi:hypothetical protein
MGGGWISIRQGPSAAGRAHLTGASCRVLPTRTARLGAINPAPARWRTALRSGRHNGRAPCHNGGEGFRYDREDFRYAPEGLRYADDRVRYAAGEFRYANDPRRYANGEFRYADDLIRYANDEFRYAGEALRYAAQAFRYAGARFPAPGAPFRRGAAQRNRRQACVAGGWTAAGFRGGVAGSGAGPGRPEFNLVSTEWRPKRAAGDRDARATSLDVRPARRVARGPRGEAAPHCHTPE